MQYVIPLVDGKYESGDSSITTSGVFNSAEKHVLMVAVNGAPTDGRITIEYRRSGDTRWRYVDYTDLTEVEPQKVFFTGYAESYRFIVEGADGTGSVVVSDTEFGEAVTPYGLYGSTNGMTPEEIGGAIHVNNQNAISRINRASYRRVDLVMIGDSNQNLSGYGFDTAISNNLARKYGMYASPIYKKGVSEYQGVSGVNCQMVILAPGTLEPNHYDLFPNLTGTGSITTDASYNQGLFSDLDSDDYFNRESDIRFWFGWGGYPTGSGQFTPSVRNETPPYDYLVTGDAVSTNTGDYSANITFLDLPSGSRPDSFKGGFSINQTITAPFTVLFQRMEDLNADSGISTHTLYGGGGQSLYDSAEELNTFNDEQLTAYFSEVRRLQLAKLQDPIIVVYINMGLNDRNETSQPTQGAYKYDTSSSAAGYIDNLSANIDRIESIWDLNGWNKEELSFLCIASHVVSDPNDPDLTSYRAALNAVAKQRRNLTTVDLSDFMTYQQAVDNDWYANPVSETEHLTIAGYDAVAKMILGS